MAKALATSAENYRSCEATGIKPSAYGDTERSAAGIMVIRRYTIENRKWLASGISNGEVSRSKKGGIEKLSKSGIRHQKAGEMLNRKPSAAEEAGVSEGGKNTS